MLREWFPKGASSIMDPIVDEPDEIFILGLQLEDREAFHL
jgi:hypothetical protein